MSWYDKIISFLLISAAITIAPSAHAQSNVVTDTATISDFELTDSGIYYWRNGSSCPAGSDTIRNAGFRFTTSPPFDTLFTTCEEVSDNVNVVRNGTYFYYFRDSTLRRIYSLATSSTSSTSTGISVSPEEPEALAYGPDGRIYYASRSTTSGAYTIRSATPTGASVVVHVDSSAVDTFTNRIPQMEVINYTDGGSEKLGIVYILGRTLYLKEIGAAGNPDLLEDNVVHFDYIENLDGVGDRIFTARNVPLIRGANERGSIGGYIQRINPATGNVAELYYDVGATVVSVAVDQENYYWIEDRASDVINRRAHGSTSTSTILTAASDKIDLLQTDGLDLYYRRGASMGHRIQRLDTGAPAIVLDVIADDVEAIQTTQILSPTSSRPQNYLVSGKRTVVRAYARLGTNTTGESTFRVPATLRLFRNGNPIDGYLGYSLANLDATSQATNTRGDRTRSYLFIIPGEFIREGNMRFELNVNEYGVTPETESTTNNVTSVTVETVDMGRPRVRFWPAAISGLTTHRLSHTRNLTDFLERTKSLVPYRDIRVSERDGTLKKLVFTPNPFELFHKWVPFNMPGDQNRMLFHLSVEALFQNWITKTLPVAMVHRDVPSFNGLGLTLTGCLVRMADGEGSGYNEPLGGRTLAHEWGHVNFLGHVQNDSSCGSVPDGPYQDFPFDSCSIGPNESLAYWGYDYITASIIAPTDAADLMSYRGTRWTSPVTWWNWRHPVFGSPFRGDVDDTEEDRGTTSYFAVNGLYDLTTKEFELAQTYVIPAELIPVETSRIMQLNQRGGPNTVLLRNSVGTEIGTTSFELQAVGESDPNLRHVSIIVPWNDDAQIIEIHAEGAIRETIIRTADSPQLTLGAVDYQPADELLTFSWNTSDLDSEQLASIILFSNDNGANWDPLLSEYPLNGATFDATMLPGGTQCRFFLITSDGVNTATAMSDPFNLPLRAPKPIIGGVIEGQAFTFGETIAANGYILDQEDDSLDSATNEWSWTGPVSGSTTSSEVALEGLPPGDYQLTLSGTDSDAMTGSETVNFSVQPLAIPDLPAPEMDGLIGADWNGATTVMIPYADNEIFEAKLLHANNSLYVGYTGLKVGGSPLGFAGIRIDPNASGTVNATSSDRGFFVNEVGNAYQQIGDSSGGMPVDTTPLSSVETVIYRKEGATHWSFEMKIPETAILGWNHDARIKLGHYWVLAQPDDYNWPPTSTFASPATWAPAYFGTTAPAPTVQPPIANAGPDIKEIVDDNTVFRLDASASVDPQGLPLTYNWEQISGTSVPLTDANTATPAFPIPRPSTNGYDLRFRVTVDNGDETDTDEINVMIFARPLAHVGDLQEIVDRLLGRNAANVEQNRDGIVDPADAARFLNN